MSKRTLFLGSATALALVVLLVTLFAEPRHSLETKSKLTPGESTGTTAYGNGVDSHGQPLSNAKGYRYSRVNKHKQLIQIGGKELTPKPQGVSDVTEPWARIHLTPSRIMEVRAQQGTFVMPDRQPRSGEFHGHVVLTLFEASSDAPVDLSGNTKADIALRVFLDDAKFDLELGQIESQSKVHLISPRVDFRGKGLNLSYSDVKKRIERLEIPQGEQIVIRPASEAPKPNKTKGDATTKPAANAAAAVPPQFYRAQLDSRVHIQGNGLEVEADHLNAYFAMGKQGGSDRMINGLGMSFSRDGMPFAYRVLGADAASAVSIAIMQSLIAQVPAKPTATDEWPLPLDEPTPAPGINDLIITWAGPMLVTPEEKPPTELTGVDDSMMELTGKPLRITTYKKDVPVDRNTSAVEDTIVAAHFDYLSKTGRIRLTGTDAYPMVLDSLALGGRIRGPSLVLDQVNGTGLIDGAGLLESTIQPGAVGLAPADKNVPDPNKGRLPSGLKVTWKTRLDLTFYTKAAGAVAPKPAEGQALARTGHENDMIRLRAIKDAAFRGDVAVEHPQFQMKADLLTLAMNDPEKGKQTIDAIHAMGGVQLDAKGEKPDDKLAITSEQLDISLDRDAAGTMQPTHLLAKTHVKADVRLPRSGDLQGKAATRATKLESEFLDVALMPVATAPAKTGAPKEAQPPSIGFASGTKFAVKTLDARDHVVITTDDPIRFESDKLFSDTQQDRVELWGAGDRPAVAQQPDGTLVGMHITMHQKAQTAFVDGPGIFGFPVKSSASDAAPGAAPAQAEPLTLAVLQAVGNGFAPDHAAVVTWKDSMSFDDLNGIAQFLGDALVRSHSGTQTTMLRSKDLRLEFMRTPEELKQAADRVKTTQGTAPGSAANGTLLMRGTHALKMLDAQDNARFEGVSWDRNPTGQVEKDLKVMRRLVLDGSRMTFTEPGEDLVVPGAGWMLMEDNRPEAARPDAPATTEATGSTVKFTGRGGTLMKWDGKLVMNTIRNDMVAEKNVRMRHETPGSTDTFQLNGDQLKADLEPTGGLGGWMSAKSQPALKTITSDGNVRVLAGGRTINTDHLKYTQNDQTVILKGDPGHEVEMTDPGSTTAYSAVEFHWNLTTNRIEIVQPGTGRVPLK